MRKGRGGRSIQRKNSETKIQKNRAKRTKKKRGKMDEHKKKKNVI